MSSHNPCYKVVSVTADVYLIQDIGPWDKRKTVTNGAERVVEELAPLLKGRRLEYIDSLKERTEIVVEDGKFVGFAPTDALGWQR